MTGMSNYSGLNWLAYIVGKTSIPALPTTSIALFTTAPTDDTGTGGVEVTGGSYARVTTAGANWNAASAITGSNPSEVPNTISNSATFTFPTATVSWGTVVAFGVYDAGAAGNLLWWDYLGNFSWLPFTCTSASPGVLTAKAHGYATSDQVVVSSEYGGTLPTTAGSFAGLLTVTNLTADTFSVAVNTTSTGSGMVRKVVTQSVPNGVTVSFAGGTPGNLVLSAA